MGGHKCNSRKLLIRTGEKKPKQPNKTKQHQKTHNQPTKQKGFIHKLRGKKTTKEPKIILSYASVIKHHKFTEALNENKKEK